MFDTLVLLSDFVRERQCLSQNVYINIMQGNLDRTTPFNKSKRLFRTRGHNIMIIFAIEIIINRGKTKSSYLCLFM